MKIYNGVSVRRGCTDTGKIPDSFGFGSSRSGGGYIRKLTKKEIRLQRKMLRNIA